MPESRKPATMIGKSNHETRRESSVANNTSIITRLIEYTSRSVAECNATAKAKHSKIMPPIKHLTNIRPVCRKLQTGKKVTTAKNTV